MAAPVICGQRVPVVRSYLTVWLCQSPPAMPSVSMRLSMRRSKTLAVQSFYWQQATRGEAQEPDRVRAKSLDALCEPP